MDLTERDKLLEDVEAFCREIRPLEELAYVEHRFNDAAIELAISCNLLGMTIPKEYGGRGADLKTYIDALVRIGREGTGVRTLFSGHTSIGQTPILRFGTPQQKARFLPATARGEKIMAFGLTEPEAGSNPLEMQSSYRREGNRFFLNGVKYLISNGGIAGTIVVFAYPEKKRERISAFIVDTDGTGIERENLTAKLGLYTSNTAMFELTNYEVPVENLLGEEGNGFQIAMWTLVGGRLSVAAGCVGTMEDCLQEAADYARGRHQHGKPIARHQLVQEHIAGIEVARQTAECLLYAAVDAKAESDAHPEDQDLYRRADMLSAQAKLVASNAAFDSADRALQILGGRGYSDLYRSARHFKDVRVCRIYEGTDEILKLKIAAGVLGKDYTAFH